MALSPSTAPSLTSFRALGFDIYGTLINEPEGLAAALSPLTFQLPPGHKAKTSPAFVSAALNKQEAIIQRNYPGMAKDRVLSSAYTALAKEWGLEPQDADAKALGDAYGNFPAFSDTVEAVKELGTHYKLVALTNCTKNQIAAIQAGPLKDFKFDAVLTAETIGSYKPDRRNFEHLLKELERMDVKKEQLLMVAQGVGSDHVPCKQMGIYSAWISRNRPDSENGFDGIGKENEGKVAFGWRWNSLGEMAKDVEAAFHAQSQ